MFAQVLLARSSDSFVFNQFGTDQGHREEGADDGLHRDKAAKIIRIATKTPHGKISGAHKGVTGVRVSC